VSDVYSFLKGNKMIIKTNGTLFEKWGRLAEEVLNKKEDLVLYGNTITAHRLLPLLRSYGFNVKMILDKNQPHSENGFAEIPIVHPDNFSDTNSIIVVCTVFAFEFVIKSLTKKGFNRLLPYFFTVFDRELSINPVNIEDVQACFYTNWILTRPAQNALNYIDLPITMKCTLRCRDCCNLMQYFARPENADIDRMFDALDRLFGILEHIFEIRILGGEPFVNPEIHKYIERLRQHESKYTLITIFTNGTIVPGRETLKALKNDRITVRISDYKNPRQKIARLADTLDKTGVLYYTETVEYWQDCATLRDYGRTREENAILLRKCNVRDCASLVDGKLFHCPYAGNLFTLSAVPPSCHEYVDLLDAGLSDERLSTKFNDLMNTDYLKVCNYCGGRSSLDKTIPPARQTERPLEYKRFDGKTHE
jgi:organic radical activating enzyme